MFSHIVFVILLDLLLLFFKLIIVMLYISCKLLPELISVNLLKIIILLLYATLFIGKLKCKLKCKIHIFEI